MLLAVVAAQMNAMAQQSEGVGPDPLFRGLTWGMTVSALRKTYARSENLIEGAPGNAQPGVQPAAPPALDPGTPPGAPARPP